MYSNRNFITYGIRKNTIRQRTTLFTPRKAAHQVWVRWCGSQFRLTQKGTGAPTKQIGAPTLEPTNRKAITWTLVIHHLFQDFVCFVTWKNRYTMAPSVKECCSLLHRLPFQSTIDLLQIVHYPRLSVSLIFPLSKQQKAAKTSFTLSYQNMPIYPPALDYPSTQASFVQKLHGRDGSGMKGTQQRNQGNAQVADRTYIKRTTRKKTSFWSVIAGAVWRMALYGGYWYWLVWKLIQIIKTVYLILSSRGATDWYIHRLLPKVRFVSVLCWVTLIDHSQDNAMRLSYVSWTFCQQNNAWGLSNDSSFTCMYQLNTCSPKAHAHALGTCAAHVDAPKN